MAYPFQSGCNVPYETSVKLKILATSETVPITKMVVKIIDEYYADYDKEKINVAKIKLNKKGN